MKGFTVLILNKDEMIKLFHFVMGNDFNDPVTSELYAKTLDTIQVGTKIGTVTCINIDKENDEWWVRCYPVEMKFEDFVAGMISTAEKVCTPEINENGNLTLKLKENKTSDKE